MIRYSVKNRSYLPDKNFLPAALEARILDYARELNRALGYDMNSVEFAIKDGVPYAIDFTNPAPDMDYWSLKEKFFGWVVNAMADMCIEKALAGRYRFPELTPGTLAAPTVASSNNVGGD